MAQVVVEKKSFLGLNLKTALLTAGVAILAPYLIRRLLPLIQGDAVNADAQDLIIAGKDAVRDAEDDLGVGGVTGAISRGVGRVSDRLQH